MPMQFIEHHVKGLRRILVAEGIDPRRLHVHLSEIGPGTRAHPAHAHDGVETDPRNAWCWTRAATTGS
jgi:hypothetical protein